ncbi:MAG: CBS domain-containing protein [Kiritimatiellales bacterium]|nr:CBS domain-containing protein [Kiritimatiellota bacterium]MBL7012207.1 CBS domain-containing protein [Kiritimatiellales bacterium]
MNDVPLQLDDSALRIQELAYGLKVRDVMTCKIFAVTRTCTMRDVQTIMKNNGISGVPVVDDAHVVGIISMNDIMNAFVDGHMDDEVSRHMISDVQTLSDEVPVTFAMSAFSKHSFRRFPVVDHKNELVGIITPRNINLALIRELSRQLDELEEIGGQMKITGENKVFHRVYRLARYDFEHAGRASAELKKQLKARGISPKVIRRAAIASYELEINIVAHSHGGTFTVLIDDGRVRITANDFGPGIPDVDEAMTEGFSTANDWIRSQGFGAGMGLPNAKRVVDEFEIQSGVEMGTMVKAIIYLEKERSNEN